MDVLVGVLGGVVLCYGAHSDSIFDFVGWIVVGCVGGMKWAAGSSQSSRQSSRQSR